MNTLAGRFGAFGSTFRFETPPFLDFALTLSFLALALAGGGVEMTFLIGGSSSESEPDELSLSLLLLLLLLLLSLPLLLLLLLPLSLLEGFPASFDAFCADVTGARVAGLAFCLLPFFATGATFAFLVLFGPVAEGLLFDPSASPCCVFFK